MNLRAIGCNVGSASVELRERLAFDAAKLSHALAELPARYGSEAVVLGTCNRVELYLARPEEEAPLRRLMVAQDTGGAIKGVVRGDVFWGAGEPAEAIAGRMKGRGSIALLLPKALAPTS